jgi:hypothetical protein
MKGLTAIIDHNYQKIIIELLFDTMAREEYG